MATQTGSIDLKSAKKAHDDAEKVATNYLSVDNTGIMVYDGTNGQQLPASASSGTKNVFIDDDSMDIRDGTDVLAYFNANETQVGAGDTKLLITSGNNEDYTEAGTYIVGTVNGEDVILAHFTANGVQIGSEAATSMMSMSSSGFKIEDDNLLSVAEIGKGLTLINHFIVAAEDLETSIKCASYVFYVLSNRRNQYFNFAGTPVGEIKVTLPWEKRDASNEITDSGTIEFLFDAGVTEYKLDTTGCIRAGYSTTDNRIVLEVYQDVGEPYTSYIRNLSITGDVPLRTNSRIRMGVVSANNVSGSGGIYVHFVVKIVPKGGTPVTKTITKTFSSSDLPTGHGEEKSTSYSYTVNNKTFQISLIAALTAWGSSADANEYTFYLKLASSYSTSDFDGVYASDSSYIRYTFNGLIYSATPIVDYYSQAQGPYYSFGQRTGGNKGSYSLISGQGLTAEFPRETVLGKYNADAEDYALTIGNGTDENTRSNALAVTWDGNAHIDLADYQTADTTDKAIYDALVALGWDSEVTE